MIRINRTVPWRFAAAVTALAAAVAVYCFARAQPPALLQPFTATQSALLEHPNLFASLPSLFFTLAIALLLSVCAKSAAAARLHCLAWTALALVLEMTQHPLVAAPLSASFAPVLGDSAWQLIGPYWQRGGFDPADLLATLAGGTIALLAIGNTPE